MKPFKPPTKNHAKYALIIRLFTVERPDMSAEQMHNDLHLSVSVLTPAISMAEDEDRQYIKLERGFVTNLQKILSKILKSM